jgi:malonate transporter and related proteins
MITILNALGPIFLIILIGAWLNKISFPGDAFWPLAERLTYFMLLPALLIYKLALAPFGQMEAVTDIVWSAVLLILLITICLLLFSRFWAVNGADFTSLFQGSIRFNSYVGLAASEPLFGEQGGLIFILTIAALIPLVNLLCVFVFALKIEDRSTTIKSLLTDIFKNPLILGCLIGIFLNVTRIGLPHWPGLVLEILSKPALPLSLLSVGAGLNLAALHSGRSSLIISSVIKLLLLPIFAMVLCSWIEITGVAVQVIILFFSLPTATSAFILARQMGGNAPLMATIITGQNLLAMITMPIMILWLV